MTSKPALTRDVARRLRRDQTEAERMLWSRLRNSELEGFKFRRQYPIGPFFADFFC
ncbi:endonuclease domain-containing protein [Candidatus Binatus sp.]|uniref:endonuclease domain-containing protein n=1 Tax=Candidatus Binatus sp. TaxID=2811406 RepID=UPI003C775923